MTRKDDIRATMAGWLDPGNAADAGDTGAAAAVELDQPAALALYRRAGAAGELIAMAPDGQAWRVPDQLDGWTARDRLQDVDARGLTRLGSDAERSALARIGADVGASGQDLAAAAVEDLQGPPAARLAEETPATSADVGAGLDDDGQGRSGRPPRGGLIHKSSSTVTPGGLLRRTCYFTPAEWAAIMERADAEGVSSAAVVRWAVRRMLDPTGGGGVGPSR